MNKLILLLLFSVGLSHAVELRNVRPVTSQSTFFMAPQWSPDGRLYCSTPKYAEILEINQENGFIKSIASGVGVGFKFAFTPDGSIYYKKVINRGRELHRVDPEGNDTLLVFAENIGLPVWYGDAIRVLVNDGIHSWTVGGDTVEDSAVGWVYQDGAGIFRVQSGALPQRISPQIAECCLPVQSPDGKRVIYENQTGGLVYVNLETGSSTPIGPGNNVCWAADGSFFLFERTEDDGHLITKGDVYLIMRDAATAVNLTESLNMITSQPVISADRKQIAFEANGRIWIAELVME